MPDNHATFESDTTNTPAVLALATKPGPGSNGIHGITSSPADSAVYGEHSGAGIGVFGRGGPDGGEGVYGQTANASSGVYGKNTAGGAGVTGESQNAPGVRGIAAGGPPSGPGGGNGVLGTAGLSSGVAGFTLADSNRAAGVFGAGPAVGVAGGVNGSNTAPGGRAGVYGTGSNGQSLGGIGVYGEGDTESGVLGASITGVGVWGESSERGYDFGVVGVGPNAGVAAFNPRNTHAAYLASACCAAWFTGGVHVAGNLTKTGGGFVLDHPLDPAGMYLAHSFVESSERKNMYDGIVTVDGEGGALVELPDWLAALNTDFRYQLTAVGGPAPNLHVAEEIGDRGFRIAGGPAGGKVSWLVTGVRKDAWATANPVAVEAEKPEGEKGRYLHPELHQAPEEHSIGKVRHPGSAGVRKEAR